MKLTEAKLKRMIFEVISEVYKLTPEEERERESLNLDPKTSTLNPEISRSTRRAKGLQDVGEIENEREILQIYQRNLRNHPDGLAMIKDFQSSGGRITAYHSIDYQSISHGGSKFKQLGAKPFSTWLKKFGSNSKDSISTVSSTYPMGTFPDSSQNNFVIYSIGFLIKGYPTFVSKHDVMSQTHGSVPKSLVRHQVNSGLAKRSGDLSYGLYGFDWDSSAETIMDNWAPYAIYIHDYFFYSNEHLKLEEARAIVKDAVSTGLPVYHFSDWGPPGLIRSGKDIDRLMITSKMIMRK